MHLELRKRVWYTANVLLPSALEETPSNPLASRRGKSQSEVERGKEKEKRTELGMGKHPPRNTFLLIVTLDGS